MWEVLGVLRGIPFPSASHMGYTSSTPKMRPMWKRKTSSKGHRWKLSHLTCYELLSAQSFEERRIASDGWSHCQHLHLKFGEGCTGRTKKAALTVKQCKGLRIKRATLNWVQHLDASSRDVTMFGHSQIKEVSSCLDWFLGILEFSYELLGMWFCPR